MKCTRRRAAHRPALSSTRLVILPNAVAIVAVAVAVAVAVVVPMVVAAVHKADAIVAIVRASRWIEHLINCLEETTPTHKRDALSPAPNKRPKVRKEKTTPRALPNRSQMLESTSDFNHNHLLLHVNLWSANFRFT
ncbi:hypothetical protein TcWFU_006265 [Taenia crassiceps]|uniref:Uncharacterized protein n=1 Tax=Taenia crassiceps TaxID=6207 RepID=A0ABR4Q353_9CEST